MKMNVDIDNTNIDGVTFPCTRLEDIYRSGGIAPLILNLSAR
jgi:hypothetical protein